MIIDRKDLEIIRSIENNGLFPEVQKKELSISENDLINRLEKLKRHGIITGFKSVIFVPKYLGGEWAFCCVFAYAHNRNAVIKEICSRIPFVTEVWLNTNVPAECGHNLALLFYSRNVEQETRFLKEIKEISFFSWHVILRYEFPVPQELSRDEKAFLCAILEQPNASSDKWSDVCNVNKKWFESKINRLFRWKENPHGLIQILPEIKFVNAENFAHCHFIIECQDYIELIFEELKNSGFSLISPLSIQPYFYLESDVWSLIDLSTKIRYLNSFREIKFKGIVIAEEKLIFTDWVRDLLYK
ncbi:MAG: hypothetical protein NZ601_04350 [candidate division WOR-3 bacterium]|nr:hypothetical protein [candidate division WOR-3 bacterium]MCX7757575.1 hypothetical protein [candidate division WOR-3 bacterium]MDW7987533.1 hypothetical protein [candidate division WOR-3 bacterium]